MNEIDIKANKRSMKLRMVYLKKHKPFFIKTKKKDNPNK